MKKVRLGIIGCGNMSRLHGKVYTTQVKDAEIVALCDPLQANLNRFQSELFDPTKQKPPQFDHYKELLEKVEMDAVLIVTPHSDHFEQVMDSLDTGLHVLVEKPMVLTSDEARRIIKHAAKKK